MLTENDINYSNPEISDKLRILLRSREGAEKVAHSMCTSLSKNIDYKQLLGKLYKLGDLVEDSRSISARVSYSLPWSDVVRPEIYGSVIRAFKRITDSITEEFDLGMPQPPILEIPAFSKSLLEEVVSELGRDKPPILILDARTFADLRKQGVLKSKLESGDLFTSGITHTFMDSNVIVTRKIRTGFVLVASRFIDQVRSETKVNSSVLEHKPPEAGELNSDGSIGGHITFKIEATMRISGNPEFRWLQLKS